MQLFTRPAKNRAPQPRRADLTGRHRHGAGDDPNSIPALAVVAAM